MPPSLRLEKLTGRTSLRGREAPILYLARVPGPIGVLMAAATAQGACLLEFGDHEQVMTHLSRLAARLKCTVVPEPNDLLRRLEHELAQYFEGSLRQFTVPLSPLGSTFELAVWDALRTIPYGETRSYSEQAAVIGRPDAVRAVARANGRNSLAIVIPCHRVIGVNGTLTGYGGGLWRKQWLLRHERGQAGLWKTAGG
jgi:AraC family transcriptional regulator of adaptative response/methylated-DNA-[protein]-cysteine methyltransferase